MLFVWINIKMTKIWQFLKKKYMTQSWVKVSTKGVNWALGEVCPTKRLIQPNLFSPTGEEV